MEAHEGLEKKLKDMLKSCGTHIHIFSSSVYLSKKIPLAAIAHQVGTCRFETDLKTSVLDTNCKAHDLESLYVVDGSFFLLVFWGEPRANDYSELLRVGEH